MAELGWRDFIDGRGFFDTVLRRALDCYASLRAWVSLLS